MALNYETTNWENGKTVLKAEHLRKIEKGITDIIAENDAIYKDEDTRKSNEKQRQEEHSRKMNEVSEIVSDIQKDYDSLQKIIIDENASANLQNQINQTNSQLAQNMNEIDSLNSKIDVIAYQLPPSNGIDDTDMVQTAINNFKKIQLNGSYIISNLDIDKSVSIIGSGTLVQKEGAIGDLITASKNLYMTNITIKGNGVSESNGIVFSDADIYSGSGSFNNVTINDFNGIGLYLGLNRNMFHGDTIGINRCTDVGFKILSSDNLLSKLNIGDCGIGLDIENGGGNVFESSCFYRSLTKNINLQHQSYYSTFSACSIDTSKKYGIYIQQVDNHVSERGHKIIACSFFGNSNESIGEYSDVYINGAKGVMISGCNFFTYSDACVKYLVEVVNNGTCNFISNSYDTTTKKPFTSSSFTNNVNLCTVVDYNNIRFNSPMSTSKTINIYPVSSNELILQSVAQGKGYANLQIFSNGKIAFGDGYSSPNLAIERYTNDTLTVKGNLYINGNLCVQNISDATSLGNVVKKIEVFTKDGTSLGFIPVYNTIL